MRAQARIPAVADATRPLLRITVLAAAAVLGLLAARYAGTDGPGRVDTVLQAPLEMGAGPIRGQLRQLVHAAGPLAVFTASLTLAPVCLVLHRRRLAVVAIVGPLLTGVATTALQPLIGRSLNGGFALPSGHTAGATAVVIVVALLATSLAVRHRRTVAMINSALVLSVGTTMATALVVNDLHVVTDTVAGFCTAVSIVLTTALLLDRIADGRGRAVPAP